MSDPDFELLASQMSALIADESDPFRGTSRAMPRHDRSWSCHYSLTVA
jgi:hypothetical protein